MYIHIALYKWKPRITHEEITGALADIASLAQKVSGVVDISCAENTSKYSDGYTHVILVRAKNQEALDAYRAHPTHTKAAERIEAMENHGIGVDFSTDNTIR